MKKLFLPVFLLLAACQNKQLVSPGGATSDNKKSTTLRTFAGTTRTDSLYGASVHFGSINNGDYTAGKIGYAMQLARIMNWNYFRADVTTNAAGVPANASFSVFADSVYNAGMGIVVVFGNPTLPLPAVDTGYNAVEINNFYQQGYTRGNGFATLYTGKFQFLQVYNELELDPDAGLLKPGAYGTGVPANNQNDTKYNMTKYKAYLHYLKGVYSGVKAVNSSIKVGMNYSWIHYGLFVKFATDMLAQGKKLSFMGLDWYNDSEYGTDKSHNVNPVDVAMANQAITRLKLKFPSTLVSQVGLTETGISFGGTPKASDNPNNLGKGGFLTLVHTQYKPNCNFLFYYELFKEPLSRGAGTKEAEFGIQTATNLTPNHLVTDTLSLLH
jgi:hypothetical protein